MAINQNQRKRTKGLVQDRGDDSRNHVTHIVANQIETLMILDWILQSCKFCMLCFVFTSVTRVFDVF